MNKNDVKTSSYPSIARPWLWVSIFFILGIMAANNFKLPFLLLYTLVILAFISGFITLRSKTIFFLSLACLVFIFGILRLQIADVRLKDNISYYATDDKEIVILEGFVRDNPVEFEDRYHNQGVSFVFDLRYLIKNDQRINVSGRVKTSGYNQKLEDFEYGNGYILEGKLSKAKEPKNSNEFNYRKYLKRRGIDGLLYISKSNGLVKLDKDEANLFLKTAYKLKNRLKKSYSLLLSHPYDALLSGFILGDREGIPRDIYDSFIHTGTVHILAISGLHIAMVIFIILATLKMLGMKRPQAAILCIIFLVFYSLLTGSRPSVVRASIMGSVILLGWTLKRDSDLYNSLGLAAFLILLFKPYQLFDIGFQLSFVAVFSIFYFVPKIEGLFKNVFKEETNVSFLSLRRKILIYVFKGCIVSFCAWASIIPLSLYYFKSASNITVIANILILPLLTFILTLGFLVSIFSFVWLAPAKIFSQSLWLILFLMIKIVKNLDKIPGAYFKCEKFSLPLVVIYYLILFSVFNYKNISRFLMYYFKRLKSYRQIYNNSLK